jgi:hypothetical protein
MIWLYLRNTENWNELNFTEASKISNYIDPSINFHAKERFFNSIEKWDNTFNLSYFEFRNELKQLAMSTWKNIPTVVEDIDELMLQISDNDYVVPIDDDDWLHPEFQTIAQNLKEEVCVFRQIIYDATEQSLEEWNDYKILGSAHVAFKGSLLKRVSKKQRFHFLKYHPWIYKIANQSNANICIMNNLGPIVCSLWHFGSYSRMTAPNAICEEWSVAEIKQAISKEVPQTNKWMSSHLESFAQIYKKMDKELCLFL